MGVQQSSLDEHKKTIAAVTRLFEKGNRKYTNGDLQGARTSYLKALVELKTSTLPEGKRQFQALTMSNLGCIEFVEGRYEEAQKLFHEAVVLHRSLQISESMSSVQSVEDEHKDEEGSGTESVSPKKASETRRDEREDVQDDVQDVRSIVIRLKKDYSM